MLVPAGSYFAGTRLRASFGEAGWVDEQTAGVGYLSFLRTLIDDIEARWPGVEATLERIRAILVNRPAMLCNVTSDAATLARLRAATGRISRQPAVDCCNAGRLARRAIARG